MSYLDQFDPCPDCGGHHLHPPGAPGLVPGPNGVLFIKLGTPTPAQIEATLAQKAFLLDPEYVAENWRQALRAPSKPLTAKEARRKRAEEGLVPICVACGDLCDRDDWLDYVACLNCARALAAKDVEWVDVEKLLGYQRVKRSFRQRAAHKIAGWIKRQLG